MNGATGGAIAAASGGAASAVISTQRFILGGPLALVDRDTFLRIISGNRDKLLVVHSVIKGFFSEKHIYATNYKGFTFVTKTKEQLPITPDVEAKKIWLPPSLR